MAEKPVRLTYASPRPPKRVRFGPWLGFLVRAGILLVIGLWLMNADLLVSPRQRPSVSDWMLRLIPLWIVAGVGGILLMRALRNRDDPPPYGTWNERSRAEFMSAADVLPPKRSDAAPNHPRYEGGTLGIRAATFSGVEVGCVGAVVIVLLCVGAVVGMVGMVVWYTYRN